MATMAHSEVNDAKLVLVSARKSRGADYWDKVDYDVRLGAGTEGAAVVLDDNRTGATALGL
jgi:hypothetical protein